MGAVGSRRGMGVGMGVSKGQGCRVQGKGEMPRGVALGS